ncbi:pyridoxamine 5'-phosphate oxidase family protein [Stenotrophomonas sp. MMGLT7]|uniref:pyridoxamine 5'-phosphate oxidase family protein n=1 Tax=Stenotrophomonas sp. MMGLT7 TaxID=2901227 RepID=UPI001E2A9064|nr:pyridoxamine 5'-phosphate oxidase family protein [Stenotrophomonas sp. MMGLT7]MCD7098584.1 pyridoxamine 5'-phosphate oxidase family protein [Stenotrophomonas sp. MMGLT7]
MKPLPDPIADFLLEHHVLSLAVCFGDVPWAANAFFAFDAGSNRFVLLGSRDTRHSEMLLANRYAAGTITGQPLEISEVRGLQFYGPARVLEDESEREAALAMYYQRFPQARGMSAPVWEIQLLQLKLTDNRLGFGTKILWDRHDR